MLPSNASTRPIVSLVAALCMLSSLFAGCDERWRYGDRDPPNVVLIVIDTLRADHLGMYGYERDTSPNLDLLAERGTVFERAYSHCSWTMPSIASILTGLEPRDHGISKWEDPLMQHLLTLPEVFQAHGYRTAAGISHYILAEEYNFDQGFEFYDTSALDLGSPHQVSSAPVVTTFGLRQTRRDRRAPFFVMLHYFDPHAEYVAHPRFPFGDEPVDLYDGEIAFTDEAIGRLLDEMAQREQLDNTIIVVVADHGEEFGDHGGIMHTVTLYEEVIRIPLLVYVPGFEARRVEQVVAETQLAPTLLALAGLPIPPSFRAPALPFDQAGFLPGEDYRVHAETREKARKEAVIEGDWKLIQDLRRRSWEMYDLAEDPGENENRRNDEEDRWRTMRQFVFDHRAEPRATVEPLTLSKETEEALKALGYLGDDEEEVEPSVGDAREPPTQ